MSNLSQFFGGGAPSNIVRGSTTVTATTSGGSSTVNTGITVSAADTFLTQGVRKNMNLGVWRLRSPTAVAYPNSKVDVVQGGGSARINGSGQIVVTSSTSPLYFTGAGTPPTVGGTVDWEAITF